MKSKFIARAFFLASVSLLFGANSSAEIGVTDSEILLGESTNITGQSPGQSKTIKEGSDLYFKLLNQKGGVHGRKIKVIGYDDTYEPKNAVVNAKKLIEDEKVFALYEFYGSPTTVAILPLVSKHNIPFIAPISGADTLREPVNPNLFTVRASATQEAWEIVQYLREKRDQKDFFIFYQDDAFGGSGKNALQKIVSSLDGPKLDSATYQRNSDDVDAAVKMTLEKKPKAVVIWGLARPSALFIKKVIEGGHKPVFLTTSTAIQPELIDILKGTGAEVYGARCVPLLDSDLPLVKKYQTDVKAAGMKPDMASLEGYINAAFMEAALKAAGKDLKREAFKATIEKMSSLEIQGVKLSYSPSNHKGLTKAYLEKMVIP